MIACNRHGFGISQESNEVFCNLQGLSFINLKVIYLRYLILKYLKEFLHGRNLGSSLLTDILNTEIAEE